MLKIRKARPNDEHAINTILGEADLHLPGIACEEFTVAKLDNEIVGIVRLEEHAKFTFLTSLGVKKDKQNQGIASALVKSIISSAKKKIFLYTLIPAFFNKFGFKIVTTPAFLPAKKIYGCDECFPDKCVCMKREPHPLKAKHAS